MAEERPSRFKRYFLKVRNSGKTKDFLGFLVFVCIAAVFWCILALNDESQRSCEVTLSIDNVPDSITFITMPPARLKVSVNDRGLNMFRHVVSGVPVLHLRFSDFVSGNRFVVDHASLLAAVRAVFGATAAVGSVVPDSISFAVTSLPPRRVPIRIDYDVTAAPGMVVGSPKLTDDFVNIYGYSSIDTVRYIMSDRILLRNLERSQTLDVPLKAVPGTRIEPSEVKVTFPVEQLVRKEADIHVVSDQIPAGQDILFFPARVRVAFYVPMSRYNDGTPDIKVEASFNDAVKSESDKVGVRVVSKPSYISNVELLQDSVEYSLVRNN